MMKKVCIVFTLVSMVLLCHASQQKPIEIEDSPMEQAPTTKVEAADILQGLGQSAQSMQAASSSSAAAAAQPAPAELTRIPIADSRAAGIALRAARNKINKTLEVAEFFKGTEGFSQNPQLFESLLNEARKHQKISGQQIKKINAMLKESKALPSAQSSHIPMSGTAQQPAAAAAASRASAMPMMAQPQSSKEKYNQLFQKAMHHNITGRPDLAVQNLNAVNVPDAPIEMQRSAQYYLGIRHHEGGYGIDKNDSLALYFLRQAIKPGGLEWMAKQAQAMLDTINCQVGQYLSAQQPAAAAAAASSSAPRMSQMAQPQAAAASTALSIQNYNELLDQAIRYYQSGPSQYILAVHHFNKVNNPNAPIQMQRKAQFHLGKIYHEGGLIIGGLGVAKDYSLAIRYLKQAIMNGAPDWVRNEANQLLYEINNPVITASRVQANIPHVEEDEWVEFQPAAAAAASRSPIMPHMAPTQPAAAALPSAARPQYQPSSSAAAGLLPESSKFVQLPSKESSDTLYRDQLRQLQQAKVFIGENNYGQAKSLLNQLTDFYVPMEVRLEALRLLEQIHYADMPSLELPPAALMQYRPAAAASSSSAAAAQAASSVQAAKPQAQPVEARHGVKRERSDERPDEQSEDEEDEDENQHRDKAAKKEQ